MPFIKIKITGLLEVYFSLFWISNFWMIGLDACISMSVAVVYFCSLRKRAKHRFPPYMNRVAVFLIIWTSHKLTKFLASYSIIKRIRTNIQYRNTLKVVFQQDNRLCIYYITRKWNDQTLIHDDLNNESKIIVHLNQNIWMRMFGELCLTRRGSCKSRRVFSKGAYISFSIAVTSNTIERRVFYLNTGCCWCCCC